MTKELVVEMVRGGVFSETWWREYLLEAAKLSIGGAGKKNEEKENPTSLFFKSEGFFSYFGLLSIPLRVFAHLVFVNESWGKKGGK